MAKANPKRHIKLKYPYSEDYIYGTLVVNPEGRRNILLRKKEGGITTTSYARYLMSVHLGRYLTQDECVDHINNDKTDDRIENLQILSVAENNRKSFLRIVKLKCPVCGEYFERPLSYFRGKKERLANGLITCSRSCGSVLSKLTIKYGSKKAKEQLKHKSSIWFICPSCKTVFNLQGQKLLMALRNRKYRFGPFCSKECARNFNEKIGKKAVL